MSSRRFPPGYQTLRALGTGQTSHVFLTEHKRFGVVALKLPKPDLTSELRRLFENEVQLTLKLEHPNVIRAYEGQPTGDTAFLTLEYCDGGTLDQKLLSAGQIELGRAYHYILQVANGLSFCHQRQVLHRDVKPANVFLTKQGGAKLGDFGTGIFRSDTSDAEFRVGTAFYMAPEVFQGDAATVRSDIYSLGVLSYEVLAGERPFLGNTQEEVMIAHLSGLPKRLTHHRAEVPQPLSKVISQAMARDSAKRYDSVARFISDFRKAAGLEPTPDPSAAPPIGRAGRRGASPARPESPAPDQKPQPKPDEKPSVLERIFGRKKK